jgi:tRNA1Val (adenine37-N6)-methyltransferase
MPELTHDTFLNGRLKIRQPKSGYRFSIDSVIAANLARIKPGERILDIGTGCGIISLILACRHPDITLFGVEIQPDLADIAARNVSENNLGHRITVICQDICTITPDLTAGCVDVVICNPPHFEADSGRINPDMGVAIARHEIKMTTDDLVRAAYRMLAPNGRLMVIYPAWRMTDIIILMREAGIEPKKAVLIYSKPEENAIRVMVEGAKDGRKGLIAAPPFYIYDQNGRYSSVARNMFGTFTQTPAYCIQANREGADAITLPEVKDPEGNQDGR